jgi:aspartyl-tRNA(Asn)/glutamyl-tRNA(Gln) amidotransferase subunit C
MPEETNRGDRARSVVDIAYVAHLARIQLTAAEQSTLAAQLKEILAYVAKLNELDVTGVEPTAHAVPLTNVLRPDEARPSLAAEQVLRNAPSHAGDLLIVPKIVE